MSSILSATRLFDYFMFLNDLFHLHDICDANLLKDRGIPFLITVCNVLDLKLIYAGLKCLVIALGTHFN
jgi:hypothetical protein